MPVLFCAVYNDFMKHIKTGRLLGVLVLLTLLLCGCEDSRHYKQVEANALKYYKQKYNLDDVEVKNVLAAGNAGLFGYTGVKDRAYEMSDGNSVYWNEENGTFADNAQEEEIQKAFAEEILDPLLAEFSLPLKTTSFSLNRTDYESYDECVFTAFYDGDIRSFLKTEDPKLCDLVLAVENEDREKGEAEIVRFYDAMKEWVSGQSEAYILNSGLEDLTGDWYPNEHDLNVSARALLNYNKEIGWYRQVYIEVFDGVSVTSNKKDFVLEEGDILFEEAGTCADVQELIDKNYYALQVDAPENKNGSYTVRDRRHENHVILDDPSAPVYRLKMSQRVLDELDDRKELGVYILTRRESDLPLYVYYGKNSYSVYRVCENNGERTEYEAISPDNLYYFGTHRSLSYEEDTR